MNALERTVTSPNTPDTLNAPLPDDLAQCHALIAELMATVRQQEREKAQLLYRVLCLVQRYYGRSSEKIDPAQLLLFVVQAMESVQAEAPVDEGVMVAPKPAQPIEKGLPGPGLLPRWW